MESTYKTTIKYQCPKRGWVEEEVEVKRYKAVEPPKGAAFDEDASSSLVAEEDLS